MRTRPIRRAVAVAVSATAVVAGSAYFTPEINSQALGYPAGEDRTSDNAATMQYDSYQVQATLNETDGYHHSRTQRSARRPSSA